MCWKFDCYPIGSDEISKIVVMEHVIISHRHYALHYASVELGRTLNSLHGPFPQDWCHLGVIYVQKAETCHVHAAVAVRLQIQSIQILQPNKPYESHTLQYKQKHYKNEGYT